MATLTVRSLQLAPLGAGDLIDRTVRLYRRHFMTLIRTSAPPVLVSAIGAVLWSVSVRGMALTGSEGRLAFYVLLLLLGVLVWFVGLISQLIVMGGASRSLVMHLLWGEPVTARQIYRAVRRRFWSLLGATLTVVLFLLMAGLVTALVFFVVFFVAVLAVASVGVIGVPWLTLLAFIVVYVAAVIVCLYIFFFIAGRVAYVPQALMVEGVGVSAAVGRSMKLARGNARRLMGMFLFTTFAWYSALMLLFVPLGWVAYLNGVNPFEMDPSRQPAWYAISYQVVVQLSTIVLAPVWMMGLSLLYVDERVRHEGYDVELLAQQSLGDMPALPGGLDTPLAPALAEEQRHQPPPTGPVSPGSTLGLN